ncbi:hypothetical protein T09_2486 [Trichinella sp. T9]|nr:hypothetical protein T09_2486 [Trichinella sp. T9]
MLAGRLNFPGDAIELENVRPRRPLVWALSTPSGALTCQRCFSPGKKSN